MPFSSKRFKEFRLEQELSQFRLAKALLLYGTDQRGIEDFSITDTTIRNWEKGRSEPALGKLEVLQTYAAEQGHSPLYFFDSYEKR